MRNFLKLAMAAFVVLAMAIPAFAAEKAKSTIKIKIDEVVNHNVRVYHLDRQISAIAVNYSTADFLSGVKITGDKRKYARLAKRLHVEGVVSFTFHDRYQITVRKGECFEFEPIEQKIIKALSRHFRVKLKNLEIAKVERVETVRIVTRCCPPPPPRYTRPPVYERGDRFRQQSSIDRERRRPQRPLREPYPIPLLPQQ